MKKCRRLHKIIIQFRTGQEITLFIKHIALIKVSLYNTIFLLVYDYLHISQNNETFIYILQGLRGVALLDWLMDWS